MTGRLERTGSALATALRVLPATGEPGHASAADLAAGMALILRTRLGPSERLTVASAAIMALDAETAEALAEATLAGLRPIDPAGAEAERQRQQWAQWCARNPRAAPRLTAAERRRAERIRLEDTPRARLAAAWAQAPDRDRRDLIDRATGRAR